MAALWHIRHAFPISPNVASEFKIQPSGFLVTFHLFFTNFFRSLPFSLKSRGNDFLGTHQNEEKNAKTVTAGDLKVQKLFHFTLLTQPPPNLVFFFGVFPRAASFKDDFNKANSNSRRDD
jgi:hypothetical protein